MLDLLYVPYSDQKHTRIQGFCLCDLHVILRREKFGDAEVRLQKTIECRLTKLNRWEGFETVVFLGDSAGIQAVWNI